MVDYTAQMQAAYLAWLDQTAERRTTTPDDLRDPRRRRPRPTRATLGTRRRCEFGLRSVGLPRRLVVRRRVRSSFALTTLGVQQLVFGSDIPVIDAGPTLQAIRSLGELSLPPFATTTHPRCSDARPHDDNEARHSSRAGAPKRWPRGETSGSSARTRTSSAPSSGGAHCPLCNGFQAGGATAVVTASTGNHAAATAWAAAQLGLDAAVVFVPEAASATKLAIAERFGADPRGRARPRRGQGSGARVRQRRRLPVLRGRRRAGPVRRLPVDRNRDPRAAARTRRQPWSSPSETGRSSAASASSSASAARTSERIGVAAAGGTRHGRELGGGRVQSCRHRDGTFADGLAVRVAIPFAVSVVGEVASRMLLVSEIGRSLEPSVPYGRPESESKGLPRRPMPRSTRSSCLTARSSSS